MLTYLLAELKPFVHNTPSIFNLFRDHVLPNEFLDRLEKKYEVYDNSIKFPNSAYFNKSLHIL